MSGITDLFSGASNSIGDALSSGAQGLGDFLGGAANTIGSLAGSEGQAVASGMNAPATGAASAADTSSASNAAVPPDVASQYAVQGAPTNQQNQNPQGPQQGGQGQGQYAPQSAVDQLRKALAGLSQRRQQANPWQTGGGQAPSLPIQNWENEGGAPAPQPRQPHPQFDDNAVSNQDTEGGNVPADPGTASDVGQDAVNRALGPQTARDAGTNAVGNALGPGRNITVRPRSGAVSPPAPDEQFPQAAPSPASVLGPLLQYGVGGPVGAALPLIMSTSPAQTGEFSGMGVGGRGGEPGYGDPLQQYTAPSGQGGIGSDAGATGDEGGTVRDPQTGRPITVNKRGQPVLPTKTPPLPTKKPGPSPAPQETQYAPPGRSQMINDVGGMQGVPPQLGDIARIALPLMMMAFSGMGGRRGFGGRGFGMGGRRGFGPMFGRGFAGGFHHGRGGPWPYHHPQFGWGMHNRHPGQGWLPLSPRHAREMFGGGYSAGGGDIPGLSQGDGDGTGGQPANVGDPASTPTSGGIPGVSAKQVDDYTRQVAQNMGIDPNVASQILGGESSYGQNYTNRRDSNGYPSYGPLQMNMAPGAMGDRFQKQTGLDPRNPQTWQAQVVFALNEARQRGWGQWPNTGARRFGEWGGINRNQQYAGNPYPLPKAGQTRTGGKTQPNPSGNPSGGGFADVQVPPNLGQAPQPQPAPATQTQAITLVPGQQ